MPPPDLPRLQLSTFIRRFSAPPFAALAETAPWHLTASIAEILSRWLATLDPLYRIAGDVAVHETACIEEGAVLKGPAIIGPSCFIAATAYVRGGAFLDDNCIIGPGCELKSSFMFKGAKLAHLNFVGDSILGEGVNCEAGSVVANYRNERDDKRIRIAFDGESIDTGIDKFGALIGDQARLGANAVIAPGALIRPGTVVPRLALLDQGPA